MQERLLVLKMEEEAMSQGTWAPLDAGKGKKMNSLLEPLDRNAAMPTP